GNMKREPKSTPRTPDVNDLEDGLRIDQDDLANACLQQPDLFYRVAKQLAICMSQRDAASQAVKEEEAAADEAIRADAAKQGVKTTEKEIESLKLKDESVITARNSLLDSTREVGMWLALKEAFQQRSYVLKDLVN